VQLDMTSPVELRRELGILDAVGIDFGAMIGAGNFVMIGVAAGIAGPAFLPAFSLPRSQQRATH